MATRVTLTSMMILILAGAAPAYPQPLTLLDAYRLAQANDAAFKAEEAAYRAGKEKPVQGRALLLPSVTLDGFARYTDQDITYKETTAFRGGHQSYNSSGYGATLRQPLFRLDNYALYQQGEAQGRLAEAQFTQARQGLILRLAQTYFNTLLAEETVRHLEAEKRAILEHLNRARKAYEVGLASITDTHEAQARHDLVAAQEIGARHALAVSREALGKVTGDYDSPLSPLSADLVPAAPEPANAASWQDRATENHPLAAARASLLDVAVNDALRITGQRLPSADLVGTYSDSRQNGGSLGVGVDTVNSTIGVHVSVPLFAGGALASRAREARENETRARFELEDAQREVRRAAHEAYLRVISAAAEVTAYDQALRSSQSALDSARKGYEVGLRDAIEVLDAERQYYGAARALSQARFGYLTARLALKAAAGELGEEDVTRIAALMGAPR